MARTMTLGLTIAAAALSAATTFAQAPAAAPAATPPPGGADSANLTAIKRGVAEHVDGLAKLAQEAVDSVFSFGELGFQEVETSKYLTGVLEKNGFTITRGQSGIPTAWVARWGSGKPVIALGSDIDGIPQASQKPGVAYHDPIIEGAPGHGEGHNTGMPLNIVAAIAVKRVMEREKLQGTLILWPGVAEELVASKAWFIRDGMFKDVDITLFTHVGNNLDVSWGDAGGNGLVSVEYTFEGETAHSAGAPWRGRSALDAVELMSVGWNYRREHLRLSQRSHSVIVNGGDQPNVVPRNASIWFYFRETDQPHIQELWDIGNKMAEGAALMTNTKWTSRILGTAYPRHFNKPIAETMYANIQKVGLPAWSDADQDLAKGLQKELGNATQPGLAVKVSRAAGADQTRRQHGRWLGRHRRHLVERPHGDAALSGEHPRPARPQLVERYRQRDADRPQGRGRRRQGAGDDHPRHPDQAGDRQAGLGLLQRRPDQEREVHPVHQGRHAGADLPEHQHPLEVPRGDEEVLLRPEQVPDLPRSARHQVPHPAHLAGHPAAAGAVAGREGAVSQPAPRLPSPSSAPQATARRARRSTKRHAADPRRC